MTSGEQISTPKQYPKSDVYERAYILKLFHNSQLLEKYLDITYPNIFLNKDFRLIIYLMKSLYSKKIGITIENMSMICVNPDEHLVAFIKKHHCNLLTFEQFHDIIYEPGYNTTDKLFEAARDEVLGRAFNRFVEDMIKEIQYYNSYANISYQPLILSKAKAIWKIRDILYGKENKRNQLEEAKELINTTDEYVSTSSQILNSYIGGFTRGYVASIIGKPGHGKSSWVDYNLAHLILRKKVKKVVKITPEEIAGTQLRRFIAMLCKISTTAMRMKTVKITDEHLQIVREKLELNNILFIYDQVYKYKDIIDLHEISADADLILLDHLQGIRYPGRGNYLQNMIGGIPDLVDYQKKFAQRTRVAVVDLSQVNTKEIARSDRLIKAPRMYDAYAGSALEQAAREFLAFWYPYRDWEDQMINPGTPPSENDIQISVEKSSFSRVGKMMVHFSPEFNLFYDKSAKQLGKMDYVAPVERTLFED